MRKKKKDKPRSHGGIFGWKVVGSEVPGLLLANHLGDNQQGADDDEGGDDKSEKGGHCGSFLRVFNILCVISATPVTGVTKQKKISLDPMAGSSTVSEVVVVVLLRTQSGSSKLLGVVEGGLCSGGREVHESVLSMTGFNIEPVFYAKKKDKPSPPCV